MKLYSYIVKHDTGFAPNPFWGCCTLANCKPGIRRTAGVGDWIVGLTRKALGNRMVYAMRVDEILSYANYYHDPRFARKIPDYNRAEAVYRCGDNIYKPLPNGDFQQLQSLHSNGSDENCGRKAHDLSGRNVLIAKTFYYFGRKALDLSTALAALKVGRAYRNTFTPEVISAFMDFISRQSLGVNAPPSTWPDNDFSWRTEQT